MKLSVLMITYNHEHYLAKALESALMQQVDFEYEIVIGEDCSTDGTRGIVLEYQRRYPERIRALLPERNLGMMRNFVATYQACRGEYVAQLEGDDYWSSPLKLQKQVDFLEQNRGCAICCHAVEVVPEQDPASSYIHRAPGGRNLFTFDDVLAENFIANCSTVFRRGLLGELPDWFFIQKQGDWSLHLLHAQQGDIGYLDEVLGCYREHAGGAWTGLTAAQREESVIASYHVFRSHFGESYQRAICRRMAERYFRLLDYYESAGDRERFQRTIQAARPILQGSGAGRSIITALLWMRCYQPALFRMLRRLKRSATGGSPAAA